MPRRVTVSDTLEAASFPKTLKRSSTAEQAADALRARILQGEIAPGTLLPEVSMAAAAGISRNTLREALRHLVREGLVRHHPHRGVRVTALTEQDVADLYLVRRIIENAAVDASAAAPPTLMGRLKATVEQLEARGVARNAAELVALDIQFHQQLVAFLESPRIDQFFANVISELRLGLIFVDRAKNDAQRIVTAHRQLYKLLETRKLAKSKAALLTHLEESEQQLRHSMRQLSRDLHS